MKRHNSEKNIFAIGIIILFIIPAVTPMVVGYKVINSNDKIIIQEDLKQLLNDPLDSSWPMYQCDAANTGYSNASFPNSFNQIWFKSYQQIFNTSIVSLFASPVTSNGKLFITCDKPEHDDRRYGVICALNQNNGSLIWKKEIPINANALSGFYGFHSPAVYNGKIFTVLGCFLTIMSKSKIVALDENTGDVLWEKSFFGMSYYSSVTVADDKVFVCGHLTFSPISWLYAFDTNNGDLLWRKTLFGYLEVTPAVSENKIFVATSRHSGMLLTKNLFPKFSGKSRIYAFNIDNGLKIWMKQVKGDLIQCSPAVSNGKLFVPSNIFVLNKFWYCRISSLDVETGGEIWYRDINQEKGVMWPSSISTPSLAYDKVFVSSSSGWLRAIDQESGDLIWEIEIKPNVLLAGSCVSASPIVIDEKVIVGANADTCIRNNEFFMFNESSGEYIWSIKFDGKSYAPFIVSNGMLFVNDGWNGIYAFG